MKRILKFWKLLFIPASVLFIGVVFTGAYFSSNVSVSGVSFQTGHWASPTPDPSPAPGRVTISEILYHASNSNDTGLEWIELYNGGGSSVDMTGYDLYADGSGHYVFPSFNLAAGAIVVVHSNTSGTNNGTNLYTGPMGSNMSNIQGSVALFNTSTTKTSATIVDYVEYGAGGQNWQPAAIGAGIWTAGNFVPVVATGHSIELINKNSDTNSVSDWQDEALPTPGV